MGRLLSSRLWVGGKRARAIATVLGGGGGGVTEPFRTSRRRWGPPPPPLQRAVWENRGIKSSKKCAYNANEESNLCCYFLQNAHSKEKAISLEYWELGVRNNFRDNDTTHECREVAKFQLVPLFKLFYCCRKIFTPKGLVDNEIRVE